MLIKGEYGGGAGLAGLLRAISAGVSGVVTASFEGGGAASDKDTSATDGSGAGAGASKLDRLVSDNITHAMKKPRAILETHFIIYTKPSFCFCLFVGLDFGTNSSVLLTQWCSM